MIRLYALILPENIKKDKTIFSKAERNKIDTAAVTREEAKLVKMMNNTGMRIGELFALETEKVFDNYCIGGEKTEAGRNRIIPIPKEVRPEFAYFKQKAIAAGGGRLIDGYDGNRDIRNYRNRDYYGRLADLGIEKKSSHTCRRTYATTARLGGMEPEVLQKILGHAQYSTTANDYIVAEKDIEHLIKAAESLYKKKQTKKAGG